MADGSSLETYANHATVSTDVPAVGVPADGAPQRNARAATFIGVALVAAGLVFAIVRMTLARPPADPTTERIQQLIDEANRLLKALDEKH